MKMQKNNRLGRTVANKHDVQTKVLFAKCKKVENNLNDKFRLELMKNRSCYFSPDTKDAQQVTEGVEKTEVITFKLCGSSLLAVSGLGTLWVALLRRRVPRPYFT